MAARYRVFTPEDQLYSEEDPREKYRERPAHERSTKHFGQLKLFLSEVLFLLDHWNPETHPNIIVVYVGASEGYHLPILMRMFQLEGTTIEYHLYDPRPFSPTLPGLDNVTLYQQYFTDEDAETWARVGQRVFLISDIRNNSTNTPYPTEADVQTDMDFQLKWYQTIKPVKALLKMRPPYYQPGAEKKWRYLAGLIYYQAFAGQSSTETRLVPLPLKKNGQPVMKTYDIQAYEERLFYFNSISRERWRYQDPANSRVTHRWDEASQIMILRQYLDRMGANFTYQQMESFRADIVAEIKIHDLVADSSREDRDEGKIAKPKPRKPSRTAKAAEPETFQIPDDGRDAFAPVRAKSPIGRK